MDHWFVGTGEWNFGVGQGFINIVMSLLTIAPLDCGMVSGSGLLTLEQFTKPWSILHSDVLLTPAPLVEHLFCWDW